jgi:hypothetical protein
MRFIMYVFIYQAIKSNSAQLWREPLDKSGALVIMINADGTRGEVGN